MIERFVSLFAAALVACPTTLTEAPPGPSRLEVSRRPPAGDVPARRAGAPRLRRGVPRHPGRRRAARAGVRRSGPLGEGLKVVGTRRPSRDETYAIPVGKASSARDHHNELVVSLEETAPPRRRLDLAFRAFDDGVAFRYLIPEQEPLAEFVLTDEHTRLTFPGDPTARALPLKSYTTPYEKYYETLPVSAIGPQTADRPAVAAGARGRRLGRSGSP